MKISIKRTISGLTMTNPAMHIIKNIQALKAPTQLARLFGLLIITTALAACGGGGGTPAPIKEPPTPPATPQNLVAALSPDNVTITWTEVPDATFYNINRSGGADRANMRETDASHTDNSVIEGNEYTYMVSACNPSSCSNPTNLTVIYDVPAMPTSITATLSATGVNLQWPVVSGTGITHYNIARSGGADRADMRETDASHTDNSVIEGNEYTYMVSACNQVDCSPPASLMVDYSAPNTPMNLVASHSGNNVTITWTEVPDATYYNIARNGTFNNVNVTALTYTDTTVTQGMTYTYMVSACNHLGCSDANSTSIQLPLDTDGDGTPDTPMNLVASHSGNNVTITWTEVPDATFYNISRDNVELNADVTALTYTDTTVMQGMTYTYMVSACNHLGCSDANSTSIQLPLDTDGDGTPGTPMNLVASHSGNNVTITWTEVPDATFYNISRDNVELNVNVTALTYTDTTVMQGMTYTYMVSACNQVDCSPPISAIFRLVLITADDTDGDGVDNSIDVDDDGDGLIEIDTAQELNAIRNNLDGTGLIRTPGAESDSNGCGGATNSNGAIITTACSGYELMADINLNDLDLITSGDFQDSNWQPLGGCTASDCPPVSVNQSLAVIQPFAADFNGNGYIIANLTINTTETQYGVGLFGAIAPSASISNVSIRNASITAPSSVYVGVLVGWAKGATISSSSVVANQITGADRTGGLVGSGRSMTISSSSVRANQITGSGRIGGLVGSAEDAMISFSSAAVNQITGSSSNIGGLVGFGQGATISSSSVVANQITGSFYVGGLVGWGESTRKGATISSSSVVVNQINGSGEHVGGLVGNGRNMQIRSSSAAVYQIIGSNNVGGLAGDGFASVINSSLAITKKITGVTNVDGLAGLSASSSEGDLSYWDNGVITFMGVRSGFIDVGRSTSELRTPTMFAGIYSTWDNGYCNPTTGAYITVADGASAAEGFQRAWNLGTNMQYPALTCLPNFTADEQRMVRAAALDGNSPVDKYKELTSNR